MSLGRIRVDWTGIATGPGISTFFAAATAPGATLDLAPLRTFFNSAIGSYLPTGVSLNFPVVGDVINESTGLIEGTWGAPARRDPDRERGAQARHLASAGRWRRWGRVPDRRRDHDRQGHGPDEPAGLIDPQPCRNGVVTHGVGCQNCGGGVRSA
jgi:hypothetical protein